MRGCGLSALLCSLVLCGASPNLDAATADPIESGRTTLSLATGLGAQWRADGIGIQTVKGRSGGARVLTWPIASGNLSPTDGYGYLRYDAAIRFRSGPRRVLLRRLALDTRKGLLRGLFADRSIAIASADVRALRREGSDIDFTSHLRLSPTMARILNARLRPGHRLLPGQRFGAASTVAHPAWAAVAGGSVELAIVDSFKAKLDALGVGLGPNGPAVQISSTPPAFSLQVQSKGRISPDFAHGSVFYENGLRFERQEGALLRHVAFFGTGVNLETGLMDGIIQGQPHQTFGRLPLATLDLTNAIQEAPVEATHGFLTLGLSNVTAALGPNLAAALNETYAQDQPPPFSPGEPFANVTLAVITA